MSKATGPSDPTKHRKRLRLEAFDYADPTIVCFVTICARHLTLPFLDRRLAGEVVDALLHQRRLGYLRIYAYVLMPDHFHAAVSPTPEGGELSQVIANFKSWTTHVAWKRGIVGRLWQRSFYDHVARRDEDLISICEYILANPVRKGIVSDPAEWPYAGMPDTLPL